jgi:hypothetical protein
MQLKVETSVSQAVNIKYCNVLTFLYMISHSMEWNTRYKRWPNSNMATSITNNNL